MSDPAEYSQWEAAKRSMIASGGAVITGTEIHEVLHLVNGVYELSFPPTSPVGVFCNGPRYTAGEDYTIDGRRVTPIGEWPANATVVAEYRY
jgi:hypothetical protein